jgi:hypothetical protein
MFEAGIIPPDVFLREHPNKIAHSLKKRVLCRSQSIQAVVVLVVAQRVPRERVSV